MIKIEPYEDFSVDVSLHLYGTCVAVQTMFMCGVTQKPKILDPRMSFGYHSRKDILAFAEFLNKWLPEFFVTVDREWAKFQELHKGKAA